jgi:hypothetical protein
MLEMIFNFFPGWLALYKTPMSPNTKKMWGKFRQMGGAPFVILFTFCLGGFMTVIDFCWTFIIDHRAVGNFEFTVSLVWWFSGALLVGIVEWFLNESRFRLPAKSASSDLFDHTERV